MLKYILKRILYFIPTFLLVSLIIFFLSKAAGESLKCWNDPNGIDIEVCKQEARVKGYDKPIFYFTFTTAAHPDTLYKIFLEERRNNLKQLIGQYGNWSKISTYYQLLHQIDQQVESISIGKSSKGLSTINKSMGQLFIKNQDPVINSHLTKIEKVVREDSLLFNLQSQATALKTAYENIKQTATPHQLLIPKVNWYGLDNQYHFWITNFLQGNFGISHRDANPVVDKIKAYLPWTLYINIPAIIIAYLLAIPLGVYAATNRDSKFDKVVSSSLLLLYSLPVFWIGTMLVNFFTTPEYGMKWFPPICSSCDALTWDNIKRLFLPVFCITYGALAFMTRQMRSSMLDTLQKDFIRT
ncbi:MAG: ABC transporter permease, partial [Bacteroidota bacterium]